MESKHKNALIGALLAVVFVMAVGYAAFAQQLTINGTAEITSNWDVHYNPASTSFTCKNGRTNGTTCATESEFSSKATTPLVNPYGKIEYSSSDSSPLIATIHVELVQAGDEVTFTLNPKNYGAGLNATGTMTVSEYSGSRTAQSGQSWTVEGSGATPTAYISDSASTTSAVTVRKGYIEFTISPSFDTSLAPNEEDTITVKAKYVSPEQNATDVVPTSAGITVAINYTQVA